MCPICIASIGAIIAATTSTGAVTTLAVRKARRNARNTKVKSQPAIRQPQTAGEAK